MHKDMRREESYSSCVEAEYQYFYPLCRIVRFICDCTDLSKIKFICARWLVSFESLFSLKHSREAINYIKINFSRNLIRVILLLSGSVSAVVVIMCEKYLLLLT